MISDTVIIIVISVIVLLFVIFAIFLGRYYNQKRIADIKKYAREKGYAFYEKDNLGLLNKLNKFDIGKLGYSKNVTNVIDIGDSKYYLEYKYVVGAGKSSQTHKYSMILKDIAKDVPDFILGPEYFFHKLGNLIGFEDINFKSNKNFSSMYRLKGKDEKKVRSYFNVERLKALEKLDTKYSVEVISGRIVVYMNQIKSDKLNVFILETERVLKCFE